MASLKNISLVCFLFIVSLLFVGCENTPFAPIAVPQASAIRPPASSQKDMAAIRQELQNLQRVMPPQYKISSGDVISIIVPGREDLSRPAINVLGDGSISVSPIGCVNLNGLTVPEASEILTKHYQKYVRDCKIIVEPVKMRESYVTVGGAVKNPGIFPIVAGRVRIFDAVSLAGGLLSTTPDDDSNPILLSDLKNSYIRRNGKVLPVDFEKLMHAGDELNNIPVMDGDYIFIPSLENIKITVLGEVYRPDSFIHQSDLTLLQVIAQTGGLKNTNSRWVKLIRGGLDKPVVYNINIRDVQAGRIMDIPLEPKDVVYVPRDSVSEWNIYVTLIQPTLAVINALAGPFGTPVMFYR